MLSIRPARVEDARDLARLRWELRSAPPAESGEREQEFVERCAAWMAARLGARGRWTAWIAESEHGPIGAIWMRSVEKIPNPNGTPEGFAYISSLYVRPSARGGIGTRLLRTCLEAIPRGGAEQVLLWPSERSRTLYRRFAFRITRDIIIRLHDAAPRAAAPGAVTRRGERRDDGRQDVERGDERRVERRDEPRGEIDRRGRRRRRARSRSDL